MPRKLKIGTKVHLGTTDVLPIISKKFDHMNPLKKPQNPPKKTQKIKNFKICRVGVSMERYDRGEQENLVLKNFRLKNFFYTPKNPKNPKNKKIQSMSL